MNASRFRLFFLSSSLLGAAWLYGQTAPGPAPEAAGAKAAPDQQSKAANEKPAKPTLRAGAAAVDITPDAAMFPLNMVGGHSANMAQSAHDPLHARALVLDDGKTKLALVLVDSLGTGGETVDEAKAAASAKTGIAIENILISSTHSHTCPNSGKKEGVDPAKAYSTKFIHGLTESIVQAHARLEPAALRMAAHPLPDEVFNRRWYLKEGKMPLNPYGRLDKVKMNPGTNPEVLDRPAGPTDPDITVLSVQGAKRKPLALWANYSLHYVGGIPAGQVSADYFGEFARLMPSRLRGDASFVAAMTNGTSGDINNIPFTVTRPPREPFEQVRLVAAKAADTAWFAQRKIAQHRGDVPLGMRQRLVTLKHRKPSAQDIAEAKLIAGIKNKDTEALEKLPRLAVNYARNILSAAERYETEPTVTLPVQVIRLSEDEVICGIPFETFVETGLDIKKRSPFARTMVIGLANGKYGYLPTPEQHKLGGYETWLGTNRVQEDASVILTDAILEMMEELRGELGAAGK